jgi:C-terminal processing protease CtpA/Prc
MQQAYFWYQDVPTGLDISTFSSLHSLLEAAKAPQDRFSFVMPEQEYKDKVLDATYIGYGLSWQVAANESIIEIRSVYDNGPAFDAGITRGAKITAIDGISTAELIADVNAGSKVWDDIFGAAEEGQSATFSWQTPDGDMRENNLAMVQVFRNSVLHSEVMPSFDKKVGYMVFDSFAYRSGGDLNLAFNQFKTEEIDELVLDLRYNSGSLIHIANQLSSQIGGSNVLGQTFTNVQYNDNRAANNHSVAYSLEQGIEQLDLARVIVLTTGETCAASEMVINSLSPFIDVVTVGETTCGQPLGVDPLTICDSVVFAVTYATSNVLGNGDYYDGLPPECFAEDKVVADWGNVDDPLLREGLYYANNNQCFSRNRAPLKQAFNSFEAPGHNFRRGYRQ